MKAFTHTLQELVEENPEENKYRMREIQRLQAFFLFAQHNFEKSLEIYTKIDAGMCPCLEYPEQYMYYNLYITGPLFCLEGKMVLLQNS